MNLNKSSLLQATCNIILVVTTYAISIEAATQKQAEENLQQTAASSRSLKYGDKTTKKVPKEEMLYISQSPVINVNHTDAVSKSLRNRARSRIEHITLPTNVAKAQSPSRHDGRSSQNQLTVQHDVPLIRKSSELFEEQQRQQPQRAQNLNRPRSSNTLTQTQQQQLHFQLTHSSNVNNDPKTTAKTISTTTATQNTRQRKPTATATSHIMPSTNSGGLSSRNANTVHASSNSSSISHHHLNNQNIKNNNIINNSKSLLSTSTNTAGSSSVGRRSGGLQSKTKTSSSRQKGNTAVNEGVNNTGMRSNAQKFSSTSSAIILPTYISTTTTTSRPQFQLSNAFNIFTSQFWQFLYANSSPAPKIVTSSATTTTKKPPKKYKPSTQITTKEEKLNFVKPKQTIPSMTTTTRKQPEMINNEKSNNISEKEDGPFRIALPTFNILSSKRKTNGEGDKGKRDVDNESNLREQFNCPRESEVRFQLFPKICKIDEDCKVWNREEICCEIFGAKSCVSGIPKPLEETSHSPILGVIPRKCPSRPLAELWWEVKECETDMDCWPRVCCPDGRRRYCRTSQPELNTVPVSVKRSFNYLSEYLECTPPPPAIFDLHPKTCTSTLDCFPNVCCQEAGLRHCRPPKKSVLTMLANVFNVDFVKRLTQNIVIK